jgi:hypothetical protein
MVNALEGLADGKISPDQFLQMSIKAGDPPNEDAALWEANEDSPVGCAFSALSWASEVPLGGFEAHWAAYSVREVMEKLSIHNTDIAEDKFNREPRDQSQRWQLAFFDDIFGNPFHPPQIDPALLTWNGGTVPRMAESIYVDRAFDRLPVLADALEEAGCTNAEILAHLRGPGPHTRGCWALDAVLAKE